MHSLLISTSTIPIAPQDAKFGAEFTRNLNFFAGKNSMEYSLYFEDFYLQKNLKVDVKSDAKVRILRCNGYIPYTHRKGRDKRVCDRTESRELIEPLCEVTYLYVKDICAYVKKTFQKKYSVSGMTKWLHANDFCYKKPHAVPAKANREQQKEFIKRYTELKKKPAEESQFTLLTAYSHNIKPIRKTTQAKFYRWNLFKWPSNYLSAS